jgi:glycine cleavage system H protein
MEQFVYSDIFATKGMEYIVVIVFLLLIIPFWRLLNKPVKYGDSLGSTLTALNHQTLKIPQGLFFNRNHTWTHLEKSGVACVGMDDLLLHLTGGVEVNYLRKQHEKVRRGEAIAMISQHGKELIISSPITGEVDKVHTGLSRDSEALSQDPYGSWLYRIKPDRWQEETRDALMAEHASLWAGTELQRFRDFLAEASSEYGGDLVLQDGGELNDHPLKELDQKVWNGFQKKFLEL